MFNLEINFLKDRQLGDDAKSTFSGGTTPAFQLGEQIPLFIGIGVAILGFAIAGGFSWYINGQVEQSQKNIQALDQQLNTFKSSKVELEAAQKKLVRIKEETKAVVNVFGKVQSIAALLQDLGDQIPRGMTITSINQVKVNGDPGVIPADQIELSGLSRDFEGVNDFLLTLQKSPFLNPEKTQIKRAEQVDTDFEFLKPKNLPSNVSWQQEKTTLTVTTPREVTTINIPKKQVRYTIVTEFNSIPAEQLVQELQQKGANGLVTRLKTLKKEGLIQP